MNQKNMENTILMEDIIMELFNKEHPNIRNEVDDEEYNRKLDAWREDRQKKTFNRILRKLNLYDSLSNKLREETRQKYYFKASSKPFIEKILSKEYRNKLLDQIEPGKKNKLTEEDIIEIVQGFYLLYLDVGYTESEAKEHMRQAMEILNYEECNDESSLCTPL